MTSQTKVQGTQYRTVGQSYNGPSSRTATTTTKNTTTKNPIKRPEYRIDTEGGGRSSQSGACIVHHLFGFGNNTKTSNKSQRDRPILKERVPPQEQAKMIPVQQIAPPRKVVRRQKQQQQHVPTSNNTDADEVTV